MENKIYSKNPDFVSRQVADEFILVPIRRHLQDSQNLYVLNSTGAAFWNRINGRSSVDQIIAELMQEFEVTQAALKSDLTTLITDLLSIQAIQETTWADTTA